MTIKQAWYLRVTRDEVAESALLVGDPSRVRRIAEHLDSPVLLNEHRSLVTVTGTYQSTPVTASAFGMGAPIAAVVLHELAQLGTTRFLRLGTAMALPGVGLGELLVADAAVRREATSATYVPHGFPAVADHDMSVALRRTLQARSGPWRAGIFASYDGFYTEMLAVEPQCREAIEADIGELRRANVLAIDMETSAVLAISAALGLRAGAVCAATVDWATQRRLDPPEWASLEEELINVGLAALVDAASNCDISPTRATEDPD